MCINADVISETYEDIAMTRLRTIGDRAFPAAASRTWNSLPLEVTSSTTLSTFKSKLKAYLFSLSFPALLFSLYSDFSALQYSL